MKVFKALRKMEQPLVLNLEQEFGAAIVSLRRGRPQRIK